MREGNGIETPNNTEMANILHKKEELIRVLVDAGLVDNLSKVRYPSLSGEKLAIMQKD